MRKASTLALLSVGLLAITGAQAQTTTIAFDSGSRTLYSNAAQTTALSAGVLTTLGDGAMLQLGYYSQGTVANPFAGNFVLLAGAGGLNTFPTYGKNISIGDDPNNGAGTGSYALVLSFVAGNANTGNNLPAAGQELVIRYFNNTTAANSSLFGAVNAPTWLFQTPATPPSTVNLSLDDVGIRFLDGSTNHFYTTNAVPEPSTYLLGLGGIAFLSVLVRRRQRVA